MLFQLNVKSSGETDVILTRILDGFWLEIIFSDSRLFARVNRNWLGGIVGKNGMICQTLSVAADAGLTHSFNLAPEKYPIRLAYITDPGKVGEERV